MTKTTILALVLVAVGCGDAMTTPLDDETVTVSLDASVDTIPAATIDVEPAIDTTPACAWCVPGYELAHYYPSSSVYCAPTGEARAENPCAATRPINWLAGGIVECAVVKGCDPIW